MMERRRNKRQKFSYYMRVTDNLTEKPVGHISDVSVLGLKIDSAKPIPVGQNFNLRLDLTNEVASKNYMVFVARSRWCGADRFDPLIQNVGFEIVNMSSQDAAIYARIIERYAA
jgi:PilZ domain-containing protein